jgi:hypothetical protein
MLSDDVVIDGVFEEEEEARDNYWWIWGRGDVEGTKDS